MYCHNCGNKIPDNANYCNSCGIKQKQPINETLEKLLDPNIKSIAFEFISRYYDFTNDYLKKHGEKLNWRTLSYRKSSLEWSVDLLMKHKEHVDWYALSQNEKFPFTGLYFRLFEDKWDWSILSENESIKFTEPLLDNFKHKWIWGSLYFNKSITNHIRLLHPAEGSHSASGVHLVNIPWTDEDYMNLMKINHSNYSIEIFEQYFDKWNWEYLSENKESIWNNELIAKYENYWDWDKLSANGSLPFNIELLRKYKDHWNWKLLIQNHGLFWSNEMMDVFNDLIDFTKLICQRNIEWSEDLMKKYRDKITFKYIGGSIPHPLSADSLIEYDWDFRGLSENENLNWSIDLIDDLRRAGVEYKSFYFGELLSNEEFIKSVGVENYIRGDEYYSKRLDGKEVWSFEFFNLNFITGVGTLSRLCRKGYIPWSEELLDSDLFWDWSSLSRNEHLPWSSEFINKYCEKWDWFGLSHNQKIIWDFKLLFKYQERLEWGTCNMYERYPGISSCTNVEWSIDILAKFSEKWESVYLYDNEHIWRVVFEPILNEELVEQFMNAMGDHEL